jgi:histidyl-tRNA synthetase
MSEKLSPVELRQRGSMKGFEYQNPSRCTFLRKLDQRIRTAVESFGFEEIQGPILQPIEFYQVKSGDELLSHTYTFEDADGSLLVLRPEMTPTVAYMVAKDDGRLTFPLRWWSNPDLFRKEKPQKGRKRQFKQLNVDIFDRVDSGRERAFDDAEIISVAFSVFEKFNLGINDIIMKINSRSLMEKVFDSVDLTTCQRIKLLTLIDRKPKVPIETFNNKLEILIDSFKSRQVILKWLSLKTLEEVKSSPDFSLLSKTIEYEELSKVFDLLKIYGKSEYCEFSPQTVRGLGYYTGTVFEAFDRRSEFKRSLMGGGRYDNLTKTLGGKIEITGVGFGFGNVPLEEILSLRNTNLLDEEAKIDYYIVVQSETNKYDAINIAEKLRRSGNRVLLDESISKGKLNKVNKQLSNANKLKTRNSLIVFPDELRRGQVIVKNMQTGQQETLNISSLSENK